MRLDKNQRKAVNHGTGPAIVVAGPGSGKTTVITERVLNLIQKHDVLPSDILAIAFDRKAVEEMETRIGRALPPRNGLPTIRTLHAFGKDIITKNYRAAGFDRPPQIWAGDLDKIIKEERERIERAAATARVAIYKVQNKETKACYIGQSTDPGRRRREHFDRSSNDRLRQAICVEGKEQFSFSVLEWVDGRYANRREAYWIEQYKERLQVFNHADPLQEQYSNQLMLEMFCEHFGIPYQDHLDTHPDFEDLRKRFNDMKETITRAKRQVETGLFDPTSLNDPVAQPFAQKYEDAKAAANAIDFEDMLIYSANLLEKHPDIRQTYCEKYPYVLVDEFQDIAPIDFRLIDLLSENLFAVGDDDQAIYGFRGGDSQIMLEFARRSDVKKYEITRNYRSISTIVEHARALIERNIPRIRKNLRAHNPIKSEIRVVETPLETVKEHLLREITLPEETAILVRTNYEVEQVENMFPERNIPGPPIKITGIYENPDRIYINAGSGRGLTMNQKFAVYTRGEPIRDIDTGEILDCGEKRIATVVVVEIRNDRLSVVEIVEENEGDLKEGDILKDIPAPESPEVTTIHKAKGREWEKVILIHNTLDMRFPRDDSDLTEERRVFYVALTRAKAELVVLGGQCPFVPEFENIPKNLGYYYRQFQYWRGRIVRKLRSCKKYVHF